MPDPGRPHDAIAVPHRELERTRRKLEATLTLAIPARTGEVAS